MKDWTSLLYEVTKLSISKNIYFSADVFDFLQQQQPRRFFHHIKNAIDARKRITAPIEIPAFSHPVRSREEKKKNRDETVSFHTSLLREYHVKKWTFLVVDI